MSTGKKTSVKAARQAAEVKVKEAEAKAAEPKVEDSRPLDQIPADAARYLGKMATQVRDGAAQIYGSVVDQAQAILGAWTPAYDLVSLENELVLRVELPGMGPDELEVKTTRSQVEVTGQIAAPTEDDKAFVVRRRRCGEFGLSVALPRPTVPEKVVARMSKGLLELRMPVEAQKRVRPRRVQVSTED